MTLSTALLLATLCAAPAQETDRPVTPPAPTRDPHHRIELRFGGWTDGWYGYEEGWDDDLNDWQTNGNAQGAFGLEYLSFIRNDLGIGLSVTGLANAEGDWGGWNQSGRAQVTVAVPVVARWYPVRGLTQVRSLEPYVTAGIGPVFGVDTQSTSIASPRRWRDRASTSTRVATGIGGRVGGGVDLRLGSVFTLGVSGAWNWDAGLPDDLWRGSRPNGGEFTITMGWGWR